MAFGGQSLHQNIDISLFLSLSKALGEDIFQTDEKALVCCNFFHERGFASQMIRSMVI